MPLRSLSRARQARDLRENEMIGLRYQRRRDGLLATCRRTARRLALLLIASLGYIAQSIAEPQCEYRTGFPALLNAQQFAGMFQIALDPPDYRNPGLIQRHLMFSTLWGRLLSSELPVRSGGACRAFIWPYPFPNLRASLIVPAGHVAEGAPQCQKLLQSVVHWQPSAEATSQAAQAQAQAVTLSGADPSRDIRIEAALTLSSALPSIYRENTLLHSLVTIDANKYKSLDVDDFHRLASASTIN
jgi:hypothetical protein